jgi:hypothetical protein
MMSAIFRVPPNAAMILFAGVSLVWFWCVMAHFVRHNRTWRNDFFAWTGRETLAHMRA